MIVIRKFTKTTPIPEPFYKVSCHYKRSPDSILSGIDESFDPPERSIFFHETSCKGGLNSRQACAVESAAKQNPTWQIYLLSSGDVPDFALTPDSLSTLIMIPNVNIYRLHILNYTKNTPLEDFMRRGALNYSMYSIAHTSDVLRLLTLYKFGGVYLDFVVVVKPLETLGRNFAALEPDSDMFGSSVLALSWDEVGRKVAEAAVRNLASEYNGTIWDQSGSGVITDVLMERSNTSDLRLMTLEQCHGFEVYDSTYFFPIDYTDAYLYFWPGPLKRGDEYIHHHWNKLTGNLKVHRESPYVKLAKEFCPEIYKLHDKIFFKVSFIIYIQKSTLDN